MIVRNFFQKSGVLAFIGFGVTLVAQQQYEGRVGINTETPSATLNVKDYEIGRASCRERV